MEQSEQEQEWTPEPWSYSGVLGDVLMGCDPYNGGRVPIDMEASRPRIVSCVNALEGVADPEAEMVKAQAYTEIIGELGELEAVGLEPYRVGFAEKLRAERVRVRELREAADWHLELHTMASDDRLRAALAAFEAKGGK